MDQTSDNHCAIVSRHAPICTVLRQLLVSIEPGITVHVSVDMAGIETLIEGHIPLKALFVTMSGQSGCDLAAVTRIKSRYPEIQSVIMFSYDYPEYQQIKDHQSIDHVISQENMKRQDIEQILQKAGTRY